MISYFEVKLINLLAENLWIFSCNGLFNSICNKIFLILHFSAILIAVRSQNINKSQHLKNNRLSWLVKVGIILKPLLKELWNSLKQPVSRIIIWSFLKPLLYPHMFRVYLSLCISMWKFNPLFWTTNDYSQEYGCIPDWHFLFLNLASLRKYNPLILYVCQLSNETTFFSYQFIGPKFTYKPSLLFH